MWILTVLKWFGGLDIAGLVDKGVQAYAKSKDTDVALDEHAKALVAKQAELDVREAEVNASVVKAEQGNFLTRMARPLIAAPFIIYLWKVVVWDKVLGLGATDPLSPELKTTMEIIIVSYFGARTVEKVVSTVKNRLGA